MSELLRCPGCAAGACRCRGDQLALDVVDEAPTVAEVVAVAERPGGRVWTLRAAEATSTTVEWCLIGGPCEGSYDARSGWPETIRAVHGGRDGNAVLDLPDDEPDVGETVVLYRLASRGFICGSKEVAGPIATYFPADYTEPERMAASRKLWKPT